MTNTIERRSTPLDASGTEQTLQGLAARYDSLSQDLGGFREKIAPGAFRNVLTQDVRCLVNHDPSMMLGRTTSGTLRLKDTAQGLWFVNDLPDTSVGRDIHELVKRGDISQCSFGFVVGDGNEDWTKEQDGQGNSYICRTIRSFQTLTDVSAVTYPAYLDTSVSARAHVVPDGVLAEARSFAQRAGIVVVPKLAYTPYVRMTDEEIANAVEEEKGFRGRAVGMSPSAVERFIALHR